MEAPNAVRVQCPECTWSVVIPPDLAHDALPPGVNKMVEGACYCNNCNVPMNPVGSVAAKNGAALPATVMAAAVGEDVPIEKRLEIIRQAQSDVDAAQARWSRAAETAKDLKKEWEGKVTTLGSIIRRMTQVVTPAPLPLFDGTPAEAPSLMETAALTEFKAVQQRLEALGFKVKLDHLDAMNFDTYQTVTAFVEAREDGRTWDPPECLMGNIDDEGYLVPIAKEPHTNDDAPAEPPPSRRRRKGQDEAQA